MLPAVWVDSAIGTSLGRGGAVAMRASAVTTLDEAQRLTVGLLAPCVTMRLPLHESESPLWSSFGIGPAIVVDHRSAEPYAGLGIDWRLGVRAAIAREHAVAIVIGLTLTHTSYDPGKLASYGVALAYHRR